MGIAAIVNGSSKKGILLAEQLANSKLEVDVQLSKFAGHSIELAKAAALSGTKIILAFGGDGTVNEVVNGIMKAKATNPELDPVLGILPAGTANDLAHTIGAKASIADLEKSLEKNESRPVDVGKVSKASGEVRYFLNIASAGLSGAVVNKMGNGKSWLGADLSFMWAIARTFFTYKRTELKCNIDGKTWQGEALTIAIANGKRFGSGIFIAPHAKLDDGRFEVVILGKITTLDYLKYVGKLKKGVQIEHSEVFYLSGKHINIEDLSGTTTMETDGELQGSASCEIEVLPGALRLLSWA